MKKSESSERWWWAIGISNAAWTVLQGYFLVCGICLYCRFVKDIPPTPPSTPPVVKEQQLPQQGNVMPDQQPQVQT